MKMELIEGSETSAISTVTPGNYPKGNILNFLVLVFKTHNTQPSYKMKQQDTHVVPMEQDVYSQVDSVCAY